MDLAKKKREYGQDLVLIGNIDVRVLFDPDLEAVRREVDRCIAQGASGGGYMIASCNSICEGMNPATVAEMFRYQEEVGYFLDCWFVQARFDLPADFTCLPSQSPVTMEPFSRWVPPGVEIGLTRTTGSGGQHLMSP